MLSEKLLEEKRKSKNRYKQLKRREITVQHQSNKILVLSEKVSTQKKKIEVQEKNGTGPK